MGFLKRTTTDMSIVPVDPDIAAIEGMRRAGADPRVPHRTRHFLYAPGVKAAQQLARALKSADRDIEIDTSARKGFWLVVVRQTMLVTPESIAGLRTELEAAARPLGGEYDRWQVDVAGD